MILLRRLGLLAIFLVLKLLVCMLSLLYWSNSAIKNLADLSKKQKRLKN